MQVFQKLGLILIATFAVQCRYEKGFHDGDAPYTNLLRISIKSKKKGEKIEIKEILTKDGRTSLSEKSKDFPKILTFLNETENVNEVSDHTKKIVVKTDSDKLLEIEIFYRFKYNLNPHYGYCTKTDILGYTYCYGGGIMQRSNRKFELNQLNQDNEEDIKILI